MDKPWIINFIYRENKIQAKSITPKEIFFKLYETNDVPTQKTAMVFMNSCNRTNIFKCRFIFESIFHDGWTFYNILILKKLIQFSSVTQDAEILRKAAKLLHVIKSVTVINIDPPSPRSKMVISFDDDDPSVHP